MNDLLQKLEAAMNDRDRAIEGSGYLGWLTFRFADGSMHYTAAAGSSPLDEPHWIVDGKEATGYASATIVYDEKRERRRVARDRKLLELHYLIHRDIGWMEDGAETQDELPVCGHCVPKHSWFKTRADVPLYPCATVAIIAEDYEIEVES